MTKGRAMLVLTMGHWTYAKSNCTGIAGIAAH